MPAVQSTRPATPPAEPTPAGQSLKAALLQQAHAMQQLDRSLESLEALIVREPWLR